MSNPIVKAAFVTEDGTVFSTKQEALDYVRKPKIKAALMQFATNEELADWLNANSDEISSCFETGTIKRVSKRDRKNLEAALNAAITADGTEFLKEHKETILDSFRWPSVKRLTEEEKAAAINTNVMAVTENNAELTAWIVENKAKIMDAFDAGIVKQEIPESAKNGLAEYRARKAAEKAAKEAAAA